MSRIQFLLMMCSACLFLVFGCGSDSSSIDDDINEVIVFNKLTGDPSSGRSLASIDEPLAQLGKKLFFTKALGGDKTVSCASCHHPSLGGGDNLRLSIGVDAELPDLLGLGRKHLSTAPGFDGGPTVPRNAPTTFNIGLWDSALFHDGRVESIGKAVGKSGNDGLGISTPDSGFGVIDVNASTDLAQSQAQFPVTSPEEMRGFTFEVGESNSVIRDRLAARLGDYGVGAGDLSSNEWLVEFQAGFESSENADKLITFDNIAKAISAYEQSQLFIESSWKNYIDGDKDALSESAKKGALLFYKEVKNGGANCASCHSGDFFTDEKFHNIGMIQIGRGKGDGSTNDNDFGRFKLTNAEKDRFAFRTPTLLNIEVTGPYGHAGAYDSLEDVIKHHLDPESFSAIFDYSSLQDEGIQVSNASKNTLAAINALKSLQSNGDSKLEKVNLTEEEIQSLVDFLKALSDPKVKNRVQLLPWIPDSDDSDPDNLRLNAVDKDGNEL